MPRPTASWRSSLVATASSGVRWDVALPAVWLLLISVHVGRAYTTVAAVTDGLRCVGHNSKFDETRL